jgi:hypothetical protein
MCVFDISNLTLNETLKIIHSNLVFHNKEDQGCGWQAWYRLSGDRDLPFPINSNNYKKPAWYLNGDRAIIVTSLWASYGNISPASRLLMTKLIYITTVSHLAWKFPNGFWKQDIHSSNSEQSDWWTSLMWVFPFQTVFRSRKKGSFSTGGTSTGAVVCGGNVAFMS